jgi:pyridoxine 5'-phosphate synthase PdxJ
MNGGPEPAEPVSPDDSRAEREAYAIRAQRRQAAALERLADAQERQARAAELHAGAVAEIAHDMMAGRNSVEATLQEWTMWLEEHRKMGLGIPRSGP